MRIPEPLTLQPFPDFLARCLTAPVDTRCQEHQASVDAENMELAGTDTWDGSIGN